MTLFGLPDHDLIVFLIGTGFGASCGYLFDRLVLKRLVNWRVSRWRRGR